MENENHSIEEICKLLDLPRSVWSGHIRDGVITKKITVTDKGLSHNFIERVRAFDKADFTSMFSKLNLNLIDSFGSYDLEPYNVESSKRLILIFKKNA